MPLNLKFSHKTPGFGIGKNFYLTVLAARAQLPPISQVLDPHGAGGAVEGFGAPLAANAHKEDLAAPMQRGAYVVATKDRKTVIRLIVVPKEETGFNPETFLRSDAAQGLSQELLARISATWTLMQLTFETHDPMVYGSLKFLLEVSSRLALLTDGVVSDPISRQYLLPNEVINPLTVAEKVDARNFVHVWHSPEKNGWVYTLGLQKFALPEFEMFGVSAEDALVAEAFLLGIAQSCLLGNAPVAGSFVGSRKCPFQVATGGLDRAQWEGLVCHELIPPTGKSAVDSLKAWEAEKLDRS